MGDLFRKSQQYISKVEPDEVLVEIGTARGGGGSTHFYAALAREHGTVLHSVDIDDRSYIFDHIPSGVVRHQMPGSQWAESVFPSLGKKIILLYLDNYDYDYGVNDPCEMIETQKKAYQEKFQIFMNNQDCVVEHLRQMMWLLPYMADHAVVICDDTYLHNDCWTGKCAAVVPYLQANGFGIIDIESVEGQSFGVALSRR